MKIKLNFINKFFIIITIILKFKKQKDIKLITINKVSKIKYNQM